MTKPEKIFLKDYKAPNFSLESVELHFDLQEDFCRVQSNLSFLFQNDSHDLFLNGEDLELEGLSVNKQAWPHKAGEGGIWLRDLPAKFELEITNKIFPKKNTSLEGLYCSGPYFITQCEAQGFRRITYFPDRPDVMSKFTVTIAADKKNFPVLLSNGDRIKSRDLPAGRHEVVWQDPFKKPCYLFALVAGDFGILKDHFITQSGKSVALEIYAPHGYQSRCHHAMESLKKSMRWDESRFGREYDLATYMIVATDDFNAGAMENKGLNVFNSRLVLADEKTATDADYFNIESVVAHEYFHNWTGNRITLRDWFHLSLKEGLTVFRDQEFSMDMASRALVRIDTVNHLRITQFAEDAGPNAHPIRPSSCYAVDNFFTSTIYEKGAEIIRMMQTMVGRPGFRKGMDLYFERHDGQAVIIEDFAKAIADANNQDWTQFQLWYSQAGTPTVNVKENFDSQNGIYTLELSQHCAATSQERSEGVTKKAFHIPLVLGLLDKHGKELPIACEKATKNSEGNFVIHLKEPSEKYIFKNLNEKPTLSLNREFSAPINLNWETGFEDLIQLLKYDRDSFNRWEAGQKLYLTSLSKMVSDLLAERKAATPTALIEAFSAIAADGSLDEELKSKLMTLPAIEVLAQSQPVLQATVFQTAINQMKSELAAPSLKSLRTIYDRYHGKNISSKDPKDFGKRRLKNLCLEYLATQPQNHDLVWNQFATAQIMTDEEAAFAILLSCGSDRKIEAVQSFYKKWQHETLVVNKWFALQAAAPTEETFATVKDLYHHPDFVKTNPNKVYSLIRTFGRNIFAFYGGAGEAFEFLSDVIINLDKLNPQVATRVASTFDLWTKLPEKSKAEAKLALQKMEKSGLSKNTYEVVKKSLEG